MKKIFSSFLLLVILKSQSQVRLPKLISDSMVLQRDVPVKIWGWASINEKVTVTFNKKQYQATAAQDGKWSIMLPAMKASKAYDMQIAASNNITIKNILIGDVWLCSGQSNMELEMERVKYKYPNEIPNANNPNIRQFTIPDKFDFNKVHDDVDDGAWKAVTPSNLPKFSAVAYFFAKEIYARAKVPIGLINSAMGGAPAEAWISEEALKKFPTYYNQAQKYKDNALIDSIENKDRTASNAWYKQLKDNDEGIKKNWKAVNVDDADWQVMNIPGYWADTKLGNTNGVVWFRKDIVVPASMVGKPVKLEMGRIVDADSIFVNGQFVGNTTYQYPPRRYWLASNMLHEGKNNITIRVVSSNGKGGFVLDKRYELTTSTDTLQLNGEWKFKLGATSKPAPSQAFIRWKPLGLYNKMIAPLVNYPIKGVIWYQGEANTKNPKEYADLMETLIADWREKWNSNFPFLFVQLANYMENKDQPVESNWAATRQSQLNNLSVPNTGMAVAIDLGDWNDIHPENKKEVGHRLALQARKMAYGEKYLVASGPLFQKMDVKGNKAIISFGNVDKGLSAEGYELKEFAIAGDDGKFVWAKAMIEGKTVIVWNDAVANPKLVRYAWADNPDKANLYNKDGLPASPFEATAK